MQSAPGCAIALHTVLVMAVPNARLMHQAGQDWLLSWAPDPDAARRAWELEQFAAIPTGPHWLIAEAPLTRSVEAIRRIKSDRLGPVLADVHREVAWWLVPTDRAQELDDVRQIMVHPPGWTIHCPPVLYSLEGRYWLERPDGTGQLTDAAALGAAFSPGGFRLPSEGAR